MTEDQIRETVIGALRRIAPEVDPDALDPDQDLREQADLDSMDCFNLMIAVGQELKVEIPESDAPQLNTLNGAVGYLAGRTEAV